MAQTLPRVFTKFTDRSSSHRRCLLVIAILTLSSGAVMFVSPYDEVTDKPITDLESKTELFFAKM